MEFTLEMPACESSASLGGTRISSSRQILKILIYKDHSYEGAPISMRLSALEVDDDGFEVDGGAYVSQGIVGRNELTALRDLIDVALKNIRDGEEVDLTG